MSLPDSTDILITGGGLAGLRLADLLTQQGHDFQLIETRNRFGGRILGGGEAVPRADLGPSWFWPGQPRMAALAQRFGLEVFEQFATGATRMEEQDGTIRQGGHIGSMRGAFRLNGGMTALVSALADAAGKDRLHPDTALAACTFANSAITARLADGRAITARRVVLTQPPRLAADLSYSPALPDAAMRSLLAVPTWMAGHAKAVAVFDHPFWRHDGLSGDAMSRRGPMVEIHDASPADGEYGALFGFVGIPPVHRGDADALQSAIADQFRRIFGAEAAKPRHLLVKDWAFDTATATGADHASLTSHPHYGPAPVLRGLWDGRLIFGGTETAAEFGGFLEGALVAAETVFNSITTG